MRDINGWLILYLSKLSFLTKNFKDLIILNLYVIYFIIESIKIHKWNLY